MIICKELLKKLFLLSSPSGSRKSGIALTVFHHNHTLGSLLPSICILVCYIFLILLNLTQNCLGRSMHRTDVLFIQINLMLNIKNVLTCFGNYITFLLVEYGHPKVKSSSSSTSCCTQYY